MKQAFTVIIIFSLAFAVLTVIFQQISDYTEDSTGGFSFFSGDDKQATGNALYISTNRGNAFVSTEHFWDDTSDQEKPPYKERQFKNDVNDIVHYLDSFGNLILFIATNNGIFASTDQGIEWEEIFTRYIRGDVYDIALNDQGPEISIIVAGTDSSGLGTIFVSESGGNEFKESYVSTDINDPIVSVEYDLRNSNKVFAITKNGLFLTSYDRGETWSSQKVFNEDIAIRKMKIYPYGAYSGQSIFFAITDKGLYRGSNNGNNWIYVGDHHLRYPDSEIVNDIFFSGEEIYLATNYGLLKSGNQGYSFEEFPFIVPHGTKPTTAVAVHPNDDSKIYVGIERQLYFTDNAGQSWRTYSVNSSINKMDFIFINPLNYYIILTGFSA